jgi:D-cysteine desulfhydrase
LSNTTSLPLRPLFRRWPKLAETLAFTELGNFPTRVDAADELGEKLGIASLHIKRDDLSAADYGGNKIRKLEFLLGEALAQGKTHVVSFGGLGSNHAIATSLNCKKLGLVCGTVLTPEPETDAVKTALNRHRELGTHIVKSGYSDIREKADQLIAEFGADNTYEIPFGGSSPVGSLGFVNGALELAEQIESGQLQEPELIYLACGTAGSVAGLALGLCMAGLKSRVEAVLVTPESLKHRELSARLIGSASELLSTAVPDLPTTAEVIERLNIRNDQLGNGYAEPTEASKTAASLWQEATGQPVSLTYTAKAVAALVADANDGRLSSRRVMFWNTYNSQPWITSKDR